MKKLLFIMCIILSFSLYSCRESESSLNNDQKEALESCKTYIENSDFTNKDSIDFSLVKFATISASYIDEAKKHTATPEEIDESDWLVTIGDTSAFNYCMLVVDAPTLKCISYISIE